MEWLPRVDSMWWRLALKGVWRCRVVRGIQGGDEMVWIALELKGGDGGACRILGSRPDWLFNIDALIRTMNYEPIVASTQSNGFEDPMSSYDDGSKPSSDDGKKVDEDPSKESECNDQNKEDNVNSTNNVSTVNAVGQMNLMLIVE
uniref:Uncharacterized protein n=1 Tax=Tanacetum cinerariifolium TaxID=118510 RepID=A0A699IQ96_TANCI|nr:hypothetical protein [Tanacetum cinerariifolium]